MKKSNYELFKKFSVSFYNNQKEWHRVFDYKLTIDVLNNPYYKHIHENLKLYSGHKRRVIFSVLYLFPDTVKEKMTMSTLDALLEHHGSFETTFEQLLSLFSPYKVGKILMALKHESSMIQFLQEPHNIARIFGPGGIDGLRIALDIKEKPGEFLVYDAFVELLKRLLNDVFPSHISNDLLLVEDLLCEFHMFYRLFGEKFTDLTPEQIIECIDNGLLDKIILSEYKDDETNDYDNFQKQYIVDVIFKGDENHGTI